MARKPNLLSLNVISPASSYPSPPCEHCNAACCRRGSFSHDRYAVQIEAWTKRWFPTARRYRDTMPSGRGCYVWGLPYTPQGSCVHLGEDAKCQIYEGRPVACEDFNCLYDYACEPGGQHGHFLRMQPHVVQLIEQHRPEFVAWVEQRNAALPGGLDGSP